MSSIVRLIPNLRNTVLAIGVNDFSLSPINKTFQMPFYEDDGFWFRVGGVSPISGFRVVPQNSTIDQNINYITDDSYDYQTINQFILPNPNTQFLAIKFVEGSNTFYGWMKIRINDIIVTILDAAYNSTPGASILAGAKPPNSAPTDIQLSSLNINEQSPIDTVVGTLSSVDVDPEDTFTYSLVGGTGSDNNTSFDISSGNLLIAKESFVHATKSSYAIRVRSTDQDNATYEEEFTIQVQQVTPPPAPAPTPGSTGAPFGITGGMVNFPSEILEKANASTFQFVDPQTTHMQEAAIYFTNSVADLSLGTLSASGPQVKVSQAPTNYRFIFSSYSDATKNELGLNDKTAAFVLKVIDASGIIQNSVNLNLEIYLDVSGGSVVNLDIDGTPAGSGTLSGTNGSKYIYTTTFTNGSGVVGATVIPSNPSAGSDPHITTIFGRRYDFHPSTRRNYTLFKTKDVNISSHFTGLKSGVYYDKVMIDLPNKEQIKVNFNSKQIKGKSSFVSYSEESLPVKYQNITSDKSVGKVFEPKKMTKLSVAGKNPVDLFVDFQTRYVHFRFPDTLPAPSEMSGLIVAPSTRLD
jgi:hypothetical protein